MKVERCCAIDPEIVYADSMATRRLQDQQADLGGYIDTFSTLARVALSPEESSALITAVMDELTHQKENA